ncbi:hypothetical protein OIU74_004918 [Salix koriyanagi]|uniref:Uncharacterized protein n=1 Tax=Salix koriyanagi TaxID=2511006 RepID=A0A9Q0UMT8_9ROSI|nr:hypothetical protein OIU74_004918 [Salix koriyanagi]
MSSSSSKKWARFTGGFELADSTAATGFHQINPAAASSISSSFALGNDENTFQIQPQGEMPSHISFCFSHRNSSSHDISISTQNLKLMRAGLSVHLVEVFATLCTFIASFSRHFSN